MESSERHCRVKVSSAPLPSLLAVTVTVTVPSPVAVKRPAEEIVATALSEVVYERLTPVLISVPPIDFGVAVSCKVSPTYRMLLGAPSSTISSNPLEEGSRIILASHQLQCSDQVEPSSP